MDLQLRQLSRELPPPARLASLKPVVRKGIPYEMRPEQWFLMSGAAARQQEAAVDGQTYASLSDINSLSKNTLLTGACHIHTVAAISRTCAHHMASGLQLLAGAGARAVKAQCTPSCSTEMQSMQQVAGACMVSSYDSDTQSD